MEGNTMKTRERLFRELCLEIARGEIGGDRFNKLLIQTGVTLEEKEWDTANRIIGRSLQLLNWVEEPLPLC